MRDLLEVKGHKDLNPDSLWPHTVESLFVEPPFSPSFWKLSKMCVTSLLFFSNLFTLAVA